jgi:outer membrane protein
MKKNSFFTIHYSLFTIHYFAISLFRYFAIFFLLILITSTANSQQILTLSSALEIGLQNNFSIILQRNSAEMARNNNTIGNAGFLPVIGLNGTQINTVSTSHQEQFSGTVKDVSNAKSNSLGAGVQLDWTLFDGMNMFVSKKMLGVMEDLGENGSRIVIEEIVSQIILTYYGIIQLEKLVRVAQDAVDLSLQRKRIAEAKLSLGSGSKLMLLQSTVDLNADSTRLIEQLTALANTKADLNRLLAQEVTTSLIISDTIPLNHPFNYDSLVNKALNQNSSLIAARLNQEMARLGVKEAQSDRYPTIGFNAGYNYIRQTSATGFAKFNQGYGPSLGFNLSYNLFNGFNVTREIQNAKILLNTGEISVKDDEQQIRLAILKLHNQYLSNLHVVRMQLANVQVAQENVTVAFEKYNLGSINDVELREIQQKLIDAQYQLILSSFQAKQAEVGLFRLSGELLKFMSL